MPQKSENPLRYSQISNIWSCETNQQGEKHVYSSRVQLYLNYSLDRDYHP